MLPVQVVTDSSAQFFPVAPATGEALRTQKPVPALPLRIAVGEQLYSEPELDLLRLQTICHREKQFPRLVVPSPAEIANFYRSVAREGHSIFAIHHSSKLSPLVQNARIAAQMLGSRPNVTVIDSQEIGVGLGSLVLEVLRSLQYRYPAEDILRSLRGWSQATYSIYLSEAMARMCELEILRPAQATLCNMLKLKVLLSIEEGNLIAIEKARTRSQGLEKLVEFSAEFDEVEQLVFLHSNAQLSNELRYIQDRLNSTVINRKRKWPTAHYLPSLATIIGTEGVGVAIYEGGAETGFPRTFHYASVE